MIPSSYERFLRAVLARDRRFDGKFVVAVRTTGVYCRSICPARPKPETSSFSWTRLPQRRRIPVLFALPPGMRAALTRLVRQECGVHRTAFLNVLSEVVSRYRWRCHAYCLMGNHYHLVSHTGAGDVEFGKRRIGVRRKYQQFIEEGMSAESIWKDLKGQIYLGDDDFVEQMRSKLGELVTFGFKALEIAYSSGRWGVVGVNPSGGMAFAHEDQTELEGVIFNPGGLVRL